MKFLLKLLMVIFIPLFFFYCVLWGFVNIKAKDIAVEKLEVLLDKDVSIESISLVPFLGVKAKDVSIEHMLSCSELYVKLDVLKTIKHGIGIKNILINDLLIEIVKQGDGAIDFPVPLPVVPKEMPAVKAEDAEEAEEEVEVKAVKEKGLYIGQFKLKNAKVVYVDAADPNQDNIEFPIDIAQLKYFTYPVKGKMRFKLESGLKMGSLLYDKNIKLNGWLDLAKKDMDAELQVKDIPLPLINVFLPENYKSNDLGIEDAKLRFIAELNAKDNDLIVKGVLSLLQYHFFKDKSDDITITLAQTILESLKTDNGYPEYSFTINTKLDAPQFDIAQLELGIKDAQEKVVEGIGKSIIKDITSEQSSLLKDADPETRAAVGIVGGLLDSISRDSSSEQGSADTIGNLIGAFTQEEVTSRTKQEQVIEEPASAVEEVVIPETEEPVEVVVEEQPQKDIEKQLEDVAVEAVGSLLKGLLN